MRTGQATAGTPGEWSVMIEVTDFSGDGSVSLGGEGETEKEKD